MSEEKELTLPRYVLYDSKELKILCAAEYGEPISAYINFLLASNAESSLQLSLQSELDIKEVKLKKGIELLKEYGSQIDSVIASGKQLKNQEANLDAANTTHDKEKP